MAGAGSFLHCVVDFQDDPFGAVVAIVCGFVFAADDGEGVHDVAHRVAEREQLYLDDHCICRSSHVLSSLSTIARQFP